MIFTKRTALAVLVSGALLAAPTGPAHAGDADKTLRVRHYENVERELLAADTAHLTPEQKAQRERAIRELRAYRERADFGVNTAFPGERRPYFVDDDGRRCAVAHLLHRWGEDKLVDDVTRTANYAYVSDLATSPELATWLDTVGLSLREAARIQAPTIPPIPPTVGEGEDIDDAPRPEPDPVGRPGGGAAGGGDVPGVGTGIGVTRRGAATGGRTVGAESWWMWWEFNKLSYIPSNRLHVDAAVTGSSDAGRAGAAALDARRRNALDVVVKETTHPDARVRAAAVVAAGRIGGEAAVDAITPLLSDAQQQVREAALLALGATGSEAAATTLVRIASDGALSKRGGDVSPNSRGTALLALGLASRAGAPDDLAASVARIVADVKSRDAQETGAGAMLYQRLAPAAPVERHVGKLATDRKQRPEVRALAVEELTGEREARLSSLQKTLAGREVELRRSAAVALGSTEHDLVAPRLMTTFELEREPLTRGFVLMALGRQGGGDVRTFLATQLREGPTMLRPWAALALGVLAREHDDSTARIILRNADLPKAELGALFVAQGLAGDRESVPALTKALGENAAPRTRAHAANALGLLGGDAARFALLSAQVKEKSTLVRSAIAVSLGSIGAAEDADILVQSLGLASDPALQGTVAVALGLHGGTETLDRIEALLTKDAAPPVKGDMAARAAAVQALGILLDRRGPMVLPEISSETNYAVMPAWVMRALQTGL
jgi:HEAT repeat protein